jgi:hypothetical protein
MTLKQRGAATAAAAAAAAVALDALGGEDASRLLLRPVVDGFVRLSSTNDFKHATADRGCLGVE